MAVTQSNPQAQRPRRVLAISSGGGHWAELLRLRPAFEGHDLAYVTVSPVYAAQVSGCRFYTVRDATRWSKAAALWCALQILWLLIREWPDVVITTGALPGYIAARIGRFVGARTMWLDSIANAQELSLSGQRVGRHVDLWLTQWEHLAKPGGPHYGGAVL